MKKAIFSIVILLIICICGCSKTDRVNINYTYKGESSKWKIEYKVNGVQTFSSKTKIDTYSADINRKLILIYNGDIKDLSSIKNASVSYETLASISEKILDFSSPLARNTYKIDLGRKTGSQPVESKTDVIKISINCDGHIEIINLKYSK